MAHVHAAAHRLAPTTPGSTSSTSHRRTPAINTAAGVARLQWGRHIQSAQQRRHWCCMLHNSPLHPITSQAVSCPSDSPARQTQPGTTPVQTGAAAVPTHAPALRAATWYPAHGQLDGLAHAGQGREGRQSVTHVQWTLFHCQTAMEWGKGVKGLGGRAASRI